MQRYGSGDCVLLTSVLPAELSATIYAALKAETPWQQIQHMGGDVPRLVHTQVLRHQPHLTPLYRHPVDAPLIPAPYSPLVRLLHHHVVAALSSLPLTQPHFTSSSSPSSPSSPPTPPCPAHLNHCLLQYYRTPYDSISSHSDKTLDVSPTSFICNLSLGATRTMRLKSKTPSPPSPSPSPSPPPPTAPLNSAVQQHQKVVLPHASLLVMGLRTNAEYQHSIRADKRLEAERTAEERGEDGGGRISLTFRCIATFEDDQQGRLVGQGAWRRAEAGERCGGEAEERERLLNAFAAENKGSVLDWERYYGGGFDVTNLADAGHQR